jgi:hypothetical protein
MTWAIDMERAYTTCTMARDGVGKYSKYFVNIPADTNCHASLFKKENVLFHDSCLQGIFYGLIYRAALICMK